MSFSSYHTQDQTTFPFDTRGTVELGSTRIHEIILLDLYVNKNEYRRCCDVPRRDGEFVSWTTQYLLTL